MTGAPSPSGHAGRGFDDAPTATSLFVGGWVGAAIASIVVLSILGYADSTADPPVAALAAALVAGWAVQLVATTFASKRAGSGDVMSDIGLSFAPIDLIGIPVGVLAQLGLLRAVYLPLETLWPDTFSNERLEQNARDLIDGESGAALLALVVVIAIGAPLVEEIFYRGLLQRPWLDRLRRTSPSAGTGTRTRTPIRTLIRYGTGADAVVVVAVAAVFALIHFRPVEYPGLFAFGLVVGAMALLTGRIGMSIATHLAFNATALALVI